jgi:signal transduction histidine kinase
VKHRGLGVRLGVAFAAVAVATALIAALVLTVTWQKQFEVYVQRGVQERADAVAHVLASEYLREGSWQSMTFMELAHLGIIGDLGVQVLDAEGELVAYTIDHFGRMTMGDDASSSGEVTARADVIVDGVRVGEVLVTQAEPGGLLTERDIWFRQTSLVGLGVAAFMAVVLASLAGLAYARSIAQPIEAVTRAAEALRRGDRSARTGMSGGDPVSDLGQTFDEMADALEAERRFEQQLTADVAHELRTPLQAIRATVEAMQDGVLPTDNERLSLIHDETVRLGRLAGSILDLSRMEMGSAPLVMASLDVAGPVATAVESSRALMESTGHTLAESLEPGLTVLGDADRITQAVGNLLSNAARHTPSGSFVRVRVSADGPFAAIEVADSGAGIAEDDRERVFTRFWRADPARARASGGLGIGLAVVREIAERHGGTVEARPSDLGGAAFVLRLPLVDKGQRPLVGDGRS